MTTATLALVAVLILILPVSHALGVLLLTALFYLNPVPTAITLTVFGILYTYLKRKT